MNHEPLTLNQLHDQWAKEPRWRKLAGTTLQAALAVFLREHGDTPVNRCTAAQMSRWLDETQAGAADTVLALSCLRNMADWANDGGLLPFRGADIRLNAEALNRRGSLASRPQPRTAGTIKPGNGGRQWAKDEGRKTKVRKSAEAIRAVGKRVKRVAEKVKKDVSLRGSARWVGRTIGKVLDHQREPGKAKMKTGPKSKRGGYTTAQNDARRHATALGYVVGRCEAPDERMRIYVHHETKRSAPRERHWIELGFTLHMPHGTPVSPVERDPHDPATYHLMWRCKKKGYRFDGKRCIIPQGQRLDPRTERSLESSGFEIIEN